MKRLYVTALIMLLSLSTVTAMAEDKKGMEARVAGMTEEQKEARFIEMKQRVEEIRDMDKSSLSKTERKALKDELKDMKREAKAIGRGGIYISFAAIIIIVLLLIIIL